MCKKLYHFRMKTDFNLKQIVTAIAMGLAIVSVAALAHGRETNAAPQSGWQLPADATDLKNPQPVNDQMVAAGRKVFGD
jgi:hypothetical protein